MKKVLKVTFGTMLAAGLVTSAFAGESELRQRGAVWVTGTYTESSNNGASYGDIQQSPTVVANFDGERRHVFVDPDLEFDYALGFSYHFCGTETRLFVSYDHFSDHNDSTNVNVRNLNLTPPSAAYGKVTNHADEVRIGLTHSLIFSRRFEFDLSGFFEWDEVKRDIDEAIRSGNAFATRNSHNDVQGWGPGIGARARTAPFRCYPNVGFFVGGNAALLWADTNYEVIAFDSTGLTYHYDPEETESVVGKLDISFGLNYTKCFRDMSGMLVDIALGVRYMNMFNVFKNGNAYFNPVYANSNAISFAANIGSAANDWGRVGPFLTFAIGGADA